VGSGATLRRSGDSINLMNHHFKPFVVRYRTMNGAAESRSHFDASVRTALGRRLDRIASDWTFKSRK
jgi:hypothetical protein